MLFPSRGALRDAPGTLLYMARSSLAVRMNKPQPLHLLSLKHGRLGRRQDRVPRIGRYRSVQPLMPYHIQRIETIAHPVDLLAQCVPQNGDARVRCREIFQGMYGDDPLTFLSLEIIGFALTLLVCSRQHRTRPDFPDRVCAAPPAFLWLAVLQRPGNDTQAGDMLVVDRNRPR